MPHIVRGGPSGVKGAPSGRVAGAVAQAPTLRRSLCQPSGSDGEGQAEGEGPEWRAANLSLQRDAEVTANMSLIANLGNAPDTGLQCPILGLCQPIGQQCLLKRNGPCLRKQVISAQIQDVLTSLWRYITFTNGIYIRRTMLST